MAVVEVAAGGGGESGREGGTTCRRHPSLGRAPGNGFVNAGRRLRGSICGGGVEGGRCM